MTNSGISKIPFTELSPETQVKYGYDRAKAEEFQRQLDAAAAERYASAQAAMTEHIDSQKKQEAINGLAMKTVILSGKIIQMQDDGALVKASVLKNVTLQRQVKGALEMKTENYQSAEVVPLDDPVFVFGMPRAKADGDSWEGGVWPLGNYRYTTVLGGARTVHAYTTDPLQAVRFEASAK